MCALKLVSGWHHGHRRWSSLNQLSHHQTCTSAFLSFHNEIIVHHGSVSVQHSQVFTPRSCFTGSSIVLTWLEILWLINFIDSERLLWRFQGLTCDSWPVLSLYVLAAGSSGVFMLRGLSWCSSSSSDWSMQLRKSEEERDPPRVATEGMTPLLDKTMQRRLEKF